MGTELDHVKAFRLYLAANLDMEEHFAAAMFDQALEEEEMEMGEPTEEELHRRTLARRAGAQVKEEPAWDLLHAYTVKTYQEKISVTTDATEDQFHDAVCLWQDAVQRGESVNVEDVLRERGFWAVAAQSTDVVIDVS